MNTPTNRTDGFPMGSQARATEPHIAFSYTDGMVWFMDATSFEAMLKDLSGYLADARTKPGQVELMVMISSTGYEVLFRTRDPYPPITSTETQS